MSVVCSRCSHVFDLSDACPRCGLRAPNLDLPGPTHGPRWQQSAWGRILIGLILAQGLFYGLRHLATGVLLAATDATPEQVWDEPCNLYVFQAIQFLSMLVGGMLAGGGQRSGLVLGLVTGAWNGVLAVLLRQNPGQSLTPISLYGQPVLHAFVGAIGGWLGSLVWRPIPTAVPPALGAPIRRKARRKDKPLLAGKIHWLRALAGMTLGVAGSLSAALLFNKMMDISNGAFQTSTVMQDKLIIWEIRALALVLAGTLAGAAAPNGLKQGLLVGLGTTVILIGLQTPATRGVEFAALTTVANFLLCAVGGWFGGALFPEVLKTDRRRGAYT